jgi:hypothetical protein
MKIITRLAASIAAITVITNPLTAKAQVGNAFLYNVNKSLEESSNPLRYSVSDLDKMGVGVAVCESLDSWASIQSLVDKNIEFVVGLENQEEKEQAMDFLVTVQVHAIYQICPQHIEALRAHTKSIQ